MEFRIVIDLASKAMDEQIKTVVYKWHPSDEGSRI
jgi:hypothetical protein